MMRHVVLEYNSKEEIAWMEVLKNVKNPISDKKYPVIWKIVISFSVIGQIVDHAELMGVNQIVVQVRKTKIGRAKMVRETNVPNPKCLKSWYVGFQIAQRY